MLCLGNCEYTCNKVIEMLLKLKYLCTAETIMSARPRPVTATVTKPPWMQVPDADAAMYRRQSLTSNGSTASLTSVLDHDSYVSEPEYDIEKHEGAFGDPFPESGGDAKPKVGVHFSNEPKQLRFVLIHFLRNYCQ